jgi:hypothetical protein
VVSPGDVQVVSLVYDFGGVSVQVREARRSQLLGKVPE